MCTINEFAHFSDICVLLFVVLYLLSPCARNDVTYVFHWTALPNVRPCSHGVLRSFQSVRLSCDAIHEDDPGISSSKPAIPMMQLFPFVCFPHSCQTLCRRFSTPPLRRHACIEGVSVSHYAAISNHPTSRYMPLAYILFECFYPQ